MKTGKGTQQKGDCIVIYLLTQDRFKAGLKCDTDFTIQVGEYSWAVHKVALSSESKFFDRACNGKFMVSQPEQLSSWRLIRHSQEAHKGIISLHDDEPFTVARMLQFVYDDDFDSPKSIGGASASKINLWELFYKFTNLLEYPGLLSKDIADGPVIAFTKVYVLADKYEMPKLKAKALEKMKTELSHGETSFSKIHSVTADSLWETDKELRSMVAEVVGKDMKRCVKDQTL